ncbi:MAG: DNA polymerase [Candidatus Ventricola sp.]
MSTILGIDIETYSSVPLPKCGVYRYVDAPDFEILLLSYAFDDGPVVTVDLACGEMLPVEVAAALDDPAVIKAAYNAQFERVCLSRYLRHWLDPHEWRCTAVMASYLTLPSRLADVAVALKLTQQKMEEGKDLIRYFSVPCKATKSNGGRTRNLPADAPDKWAVYKQYNAQDVETERAVRKALEAWPLSEHEWEVYALDQIINDRGVRVDKRLVKNAIAVDEVFTEAAYQRAKELTGLENPGSVAKLKAWLADQDMPMESLAKKIVQEKAVQAEGIVAELLNLRLELSKTSVKKYEAIARTVCRDGRVHGLLQYYGASRTGRWCLTGDHEVLTDNGWMRLDEWKGGKIACWNGANEVVSFQKAEMVCFDYDGPMYTYRSTRIDQCSTPDHKMRIQQRYGYPWTDVTVEKMGEISRPCIPFTGCRHVRSSTNPNWLRILVMMQADGSYAEAGVLRFHFKKQRKIERCKMLLRKAEIPFSVSKETNGAYSIDVPGRFVPLWLREFRTKTFGWWLLDENADIIFDELPHWDGCYPAPNSIQYSTTNKQNADVLQALAHLSGRSCIVRMRNAANENRNTSYILDIWLTPGNCHELREKPVIEEYKGKVYCAVTKTGFFLVRRNGKVWVTGNSGRLVQVQNLPQNHLPDLMLARDTVLQGDEQQLELLFGSVPGTLSELIRTAFIPKDGCRFIVADFSAIEARVLAWLAGEEWVLEEFRGKGKIYEATASRMFHIPQETIVKGHPNYEYRQKGKQAVLSCGYGGGVGALKAMGAKMPEEEMQPLIDAWRAANPSIVAFWSAMDRAARMVIRRKETARAGKVTLYWKDDKLLIRLPSGRNLCYQSPHFTENRFGSNAIGYYAPNAAGQMVEQETFGGKLTENVTQAIARDILAHAMLNLEAAGYPIVFHVHDEAVMEMPEGQGSLEEACGIMAIPPEWAKDLPLRADGDELPYYRK